MRPFVLLLMVILIAGSAQGSGLLLDKGQSGAFVEGGYGTGPDFYSIAVDGGYSFNGRVDIGAGLSFARMKVSQVRTEDVVAVSQLMQAHFLRLSLGNKGSVNLSGHEALSTAIDHFLREPYTLLTLGGSLTLGIRPSGKFGVLLSGGYSRVTGVRAGGPPDAENLQFDLALTLWDKESTVALVSSIVLNEDDLTLYAVSISLAFPEK